MKTVRVRIAVRVGRTGEWVAYGSDEERNDPARMDAVAGYWVPETGEPIGVHYIEADVPLPTAEVIEGEVTPADDSELSGGGG